MSTTKSYTPLEFTVSLWFRTGSKAGGRLAGLGDSRYDSSGLTDRVLGMDSSGRLWFGVAPGRDTGAAGTAVTVISPLAYNDGLWHHAVAVLSKTSGQALYIDGGLAAADTASRTAGSYLGYWRLGSDRMDGWAPHAPGLWQGLIREAWILHRPMDAGWVRAQYASSRPGARFLAPEP
jgi:hypothetical protein